MNVFCLIRAGFHDELKRDGPIEHHGRIRRRVVRARNRELDYPSLIKVICSGGLEIKPWYVIVGSIRSHAEV